MLIVFSAMIGFVFTLIACAVISEVMIDTNIIIFGLVWIGITLLILLFFINVEYKYMCKKKSTHKWKTITYKELKEKMAYNLQHDVLHVGIYDATDCPRIYIFDDDKYIIMRYQNDFIEENNVMCVLSYWDHVKYSLFGLNSFVKKMRKAYENTNKIK